MALRSERALAAVVQEPPSTERPARSGAGAAARAPGRGGWRPHALALGCYTLIALLVTWPLALHMGDRIIANQPGQVDGLLSVWNIWWSGHALQTGQSPFQTPLLFFPDGLDLFWLWLSFPNALLVMPVALAVGPLPAYNLIILLGYILGGYAAFLFIRHFCPDDAAALIGGAVYALAPFHTRRVLDAVMDTASIQWVPLYLLALHILLERRRLRWALLTALLLIVVCLGSWYYGLFCLIYTGLAALVWAAGAPDRRGRLRLLLWGLLPGLIWAAVLAPRLLSMAQHGDRLLGVARDVNDSNSADLIAFWLPNPFHPLWGAAVTRFYERLHPEAWLWQISFGLVGTALALVAVWTGWRRHWRWLVLLAATMLVALGERLHAFGLVTDIPMPYRLLAGLPGIRTSHRPNHVVIISILLVGLLAAFGARELLRRRPVWRWPVVGLALLAALAVDGWAGPMPLFSRPIPAAYGALPPPDGGAVLPVPINLNLSRSENLWYQTRHGWPIIAGYTGREPPYPIGSYAPGIATLRFGDPQRDDILAPGWPDLARETLAALKIRYVLLHPPTMGDSLAPIRELLAEQGLRASHSDAELEIYPVPPTERPRPLAYLGAGWGPLERDGGRRWRWMGERAELHLINPHDRPAVVTLALELEAYQRDRPLSLQLDGGPPATLDVSRAAMRRRISLLLTPGQHVVYLGAPADPRPDASGQPLSVAFFEIAVEGD